MGVPWQDAPIDDRQRLRTQSGNHVVSMLGYLFTFDPIEYSTGSGKQHKKINKETSVSHFDALLVQVIE